MSTKAVVRLVILAALLIASAARAEETAVSGTKIAPSVGSDRQLEIIAKRGTNQVKVDGEDSQKIGYRSWGAQLHYQPRNFVLDVSGTNLDRDIEEIRMDGTTQKTTTIVTPGIGYRVTPTFMVYANYSDIRTQVNNDLYGDDGYALDTRRGSVSFFWQGEADRLTVTYSSEARAEKKYEVGDLALDGYEIPMTDRDYVPAQLEVKYGRELKWPVGAFGKVRYSQYNDDVYKDDYESDVPKTPTAAQVFDYLLSLEVGATYEVVKNVGLLAAFDRKAALDTNSYTGDEYLVGNAAMIGAEAKLSDAARVGASATTSTGSKRHEVQGQSYDYANRLSRFEAALTLSM